MLIQSPNVMRLACLLMLAAVPIVAVATHGAPDAQAANGTPAEKAVAGAAEGAEVARVQVAAVPEQPATPVGTVSGLPIPRYVSLKSDRVNLREGPSKDHRVTWVFQRAGLPVEVTAEFETWRRIRDSEGAEGWVLHSLLSGRRTALVAPWEKGQTFDMRDQTDAKSPITARLQAGVIANVRSCDGTWCSVMVRDVAGYMKQDRLWGVYPHEQVK
ncbi:SH3 domain-containing protein [Chelatococcus asaccharovorans]|uniref:SH3-like domain-containing protein n=1 Tax=Chelatococcus asaccharovorans TaxID=28210 RepID=A0A2V3U775_9HYPH|nr:SH3 domain-containing protein [Chelatococcus asaccharovorans]PXW58925.1 SH3-like domain-containing protein [Chelatococcus asaccharovorans]